MPTGSFTLTNLPIGPYRLEVALAGFRTFVQTGIVLQVGSNPVIPVTLQLGELAETVSVEASAPLVETRNPSHRRRHRERAHRGAAAQRPQLRGSDRDRGRGGAARGRRPAAACRAHQAAWAIRVAGGQAFGVAYLLDGAIHNNPYDNFNLPLPFPDALQEFRVETSSQNAQNGFHSGASVNAVTKSGTNLFHGDLFEFVRHHRFNATNPFNADRSCHAASGATTA